MKKFLTLIALLFVVTLSQAQYSATGANTILTQSEQYITNSPTSVVGNRVNMLILKDSIRWENRWKGVMWTKYTSAKNDGLPSGLLWTGTDGAMKHSPMSEVRLPYSQLTGTPSLFSGNYNDLTNKPSLFSGAYSDLTGKPSLFSGDYNDLTNKPSIPASQVNSDWNSVTGLATILNKPTLFSGAYADLTGKPSLFSGAYADLTGKPTLFSGNYVDLIGKPTLFSGAYADLTGKPTIPAAQVNSDWSASSGIAQILNKPTLFSGVYADLTGKPTLFSGSYLDLTNKPVIPVAVSLTTNGTSGVATYNSGTGVLNVPNYTYTPVARVYNNNVSRTLNSNYTISSTRDSRVNYSIALSVTNPLLAGSSTASAFLEYSTDGGTSWITVSQVVNASSVGLTVSLQLTQPNTFILSGDIPANALVRIRTTVAGTATATYTRGQETLE